MPRPAKPLALHLADGNKRHLTKAEIDARQKSEIKFGGQKMRCPDYIKACPAALSKWRELVRLYKDVDFIGSGDAGSLAMYCKTYAEYLALQKAYQTVDSIAYDGVKLDDYIEETDEFNYKVKQQLRAMLAVDGLLRIESAINKKVATLIKMEDRLFLNPLAKVRNVPKPEPVKEQSRFEKEGFNV